MNETREQQILEYCKEAKPLAAIALECDLSIGYLMREIIPLLVYGNKIMKLTSGSGKRLYKTNPNYFKENVEGN